VIAGIAGIEEQNLATDKRGSGNRMKSPESHVIAGIAVIEEQNITADKRG
jgi:hypothetical protein